MKLRFAIPSLVLAFALGVGTGVFALWYLVLRGPDAAFIADANQSNQVTIDMQGVYDVTLLPLNKDGGPQSNCQLSAYLSASNGVDDIEVGSAGSGGGVPALARHIFLRPGTYTFHVDSTCDHYMAQIGAVQH